MSLLTQFEIDGTWTNVADGDSLLYTLAQETGVSLDVIGQSVEGIDLLRVTMGTGEETMLITSGVHGFEPASREAILMKIRDMAVNANGQYTDFLANYKIVFVPTLNPDKMHQTYNNADNIDINRGVYPLNSPEARAFAKVLTDANPYMFVDFHETSGSASDAVSFVRATHLDPNSDIGIKNAVNDAIGSIRSKIIAKGLRGLYYSSDYTGFGSLTSGAGILGTVTFTSETYWNGDPQGRVNLQLDVFDFSLAWFQDNFAYVKQTKDAFVSNMLKTGDPFTLLTGLQPGSEFYNSAIQVPITVPYAYKLENPAYFELWKEAYAITINDDGTIPINQRSGRMLPHLLDPQSDIAVTTATRIEEEPAEPERRTDGRYTKVLYEEWREVFIKYM